MNRIESPTEGHANSRKPEFSADELRAMSDKDIASLTRASALGCSDRTIARILVEAAKRLGTARR